MGVISGLASGQDIASNIVILGVFLIGAVVGIIAFSKFLHWLLARWNKETLIVLAGFIIGSLVKVWPWSNTEAIVCSQFPEVAALAEAAENAVEVSPAAYDSALSAYKAAVAANAPLIDTQVTSAVILAIIGFSLVTGIEMAGKILSKNKKA
jgi:putative membrane protein